MDMMFWIWLGVIVVTVIVEIVTLELVSIWFSFGAIIPFILSAFKGAVPMEIQIVIFVVVSALLILLLRKYAQKLLFKNTDEKTNIDSFKGKKIRLLEDASFEKSGSIKINDVVWTATSQDGSLLKAGELVEIVSIDGNKCIVKKAEKDPEESKVVNLTENDDEFIIEKTKTDDKKEEN